MNGKNAENLRHRNAREHVSSIFQNRRPLSAGTPHPNGKLNYTEYKDGSFRGDSNTIKLVMFKDKIVIPQLLQKMRCEMVSRIFLHQRLYKSERLFSNIYTDRH